MPLAATDARTASLPLLLCAVVTCVVSFFLPCAASTAQISGTASVHSSYIDVGTFNDRFSDDPIAEATLLIEPGGNFYIEPYVVSGFSRPLRGEGSEYGLEIGWEKEVRSDIRASVAVGRWANYDGRGFRSGDWFGRLGVEHKGLTVSAAVLRGTSNTTIVSLHYELSLIPKMTIQPVISLDTNESSVSAGAAISYRLFSRLAFEARVVSPERDERRQAHVSAGLVWSFGEIKGE